MTTVREIVLPGEKVGDAAEHRPGMNTTTEGKDIVALRLGVKSVRGDRINVISLNGRYEPNRGDMVIGTVAEVGPSNWYINVGSANDVGMHVNDVPWRVEFGETSKYLAVGDSVLLKIVHVDELRKAQVSMKDRQCRKLTGGLIFEVNPSKVPRIVGRQGSMITMLKDYTDVRIFVGQNGVIWVDGEPDDVALALEALHKIEDEAHTSGLTDRMKAWFEEKRPGRTPRAHEEREEETAEEPREERQEARTERPEPRERGERRERQRDERAERRRREESEEGEAPRGPPERREREERDERRGERRGREEREERRPRREEREPRRMRDADESDAAEERRPKRVPPVFEGSDEEPTTEDEDEDEEVLQTSEEVPREERRGGDREKRGAGGNGGGGGGRRRRGGRGRRGGGRGKEE